MIQLFADHIPVSSCELNNLRVIVSHNMAPNLSATNLAQDEMRYYHWQKSIDPLTVPGNRRLEGWKVQDGALSFGFGAGVSFTGGGDLFRLVGFFMYIDSPGDDEKGFVFSIELYYGKPSNANDQQCKLLEPRNRVYSLSTT